jgi:hypothetical protein
MFRRPFICNDPAPYHLSRLHVVDGFCAVVMFVSLEITDIPLSTVVPATYQVDNEEVDHLGTYFGTLFICIDISLPHVTRLQVCDPKGVYSCITNIRNNSILNHA